LADPRAIPLVINAGSLAKTLPQPESDPAWPIWVTSNSNPTRPNALNYDKYIIFRSGRVATGNSRERKRLTSMVDDRMRSIDEGIFGLGS
jgi:hypothetical protein